MKNLFTKILFLIWGVTNAQCITNGTLNSTCQGDGYNSSSCVQGWQASHGSPSVFGTVNANTWAWLWSHSNIGEGIFTNYNFVAGRTYQISFRVRTSTNVSNPNNTVLNSTANVRAVSGLTTTTSTTIPGALSGGQLVWQNTIGSNINNWSTVNVSYTPSQNNTQLCFYPLMTANSGSNGRAQIQMEVDDITITPPVTSVFHFEDANNNMKTDFCFGESIFLDGTASFGENQYYLDVWRRPIGSTGAFQWQAQLGGNGWTQGQLGTLNLTSIFNGQGYSFVAGYEYQIKVATSSSPCVGWVPTTHEFRVLNSDASSNFTFNSFCAPDGTITVTVTASDTSAGLNHWWGLIETSIPNSTTDPNSSQVGATQSGNTTTFTGLSKDKNYYIKHGVYNSCVAWRESRTALPKTASWSGYTTNFTINASNVGNNVSVTAIANSNPVFVNHHWSISYAPNGNTSGNNPVPGNPIICCNSSSATFNTNLIINEWYYIKHGIWNDCAEWGETRKAFRIVVQKLSTNGTPNYVVETKDVKEVSIENLNKKSDNTIIEQLSPNPTTKGSTCSFTTDSKNVDEVIIMDLLGKTSSVKFSIKDSNTITFSLNDSFTKGIYVIKVVKKDNTVSTKKLIIE